MLKITVGERRVAYNEQEPQTAWLCPWCLSMRSSRSLIKSHQDVSDQEGCKKEEPQEFILFPVTGD